MRAIILLLICLLALKGGPTFYGFNEKYIQFAIKKKEIYKTGLQFGWCWIRTFSWTFGAALPAVPGPPPPSAGLKLLSFFNFLLWKSEQVFSNVLPQVSLCIVHPDNILPCRISVFLLKMSICRRSIFYNKKIPYYQRPIFVVPVPCNQGSILCPFALYYLPNRFMFNFLISRIFCREREY